MTTAKKELILNIIKHLEEAARIAEENPEIDYGNEYEDIMLEYNGSLVNVAQACGHMISFFNEKIAESDN